MAEVVAENVVDFLSAIEDGAELMFRGQSNVDWPLLPSLVRYASSYCRDGWDSLAALEDHLMHRFSMFCMPSVDLRGKSKFEKVMYVQHYGLPSRVLDWSTNPLKALWFAVEDGSYDHVSGVVYITSPKLWAEVDGDVEDVDDGFLACFPFYFHERIVSQDSCVISFPLSRSSMVAEEFSRESSSGRFEFLKRIVVPAECKLSLRRQLSILGINARTVFPGVEGVSRWIKSDIANYVV